MASVRDLRERIKSVGNIKQITRAMEMVATTKLRRFQDRAVASRPFTHEITQLLTHLAEVMGDQLDDQPLFRDGPGEAVAVVVVSSDRGLCGAYNSNLFAKLEQMLREREGQDVRFFAFGRRAAQYVKKRGLVLERFFADPPLEEISYAMAKRTARILTEAFLAGEYREVRVLYTAFESMVRYVPTEIGLLPIRADEPGDPSGAPGADGEGAAKKGGDVILEPDAVTLLEKLLPRYLETRLFNALLEAITSEYASRRMSMKNATDAATDMQGLLKGQYNRKRQEGITKDLLDIVGGAEAVR